VPRWGHVETIGELLVGQLLDDAELKRVALARGQTVELIGERETWGEPFFDLRETILGGEVERETEPLTSSRLDLVSANRVHEQVARDSKQPRQRPSAMFVMELLAAEKRPSERLGGQIARSPGQPTGQPAVHLADVPAIQL
jgi:hypothetical protein